MTVWKGGRGSKPSYKTTHVRIPEPMKTQVDALAGTYRELVWDGKDSEAEELLNRVESAIVATSYKSSNKIPSLEEAKEKAKKIIGRKKSAKISVEMLLKVLYSEEISLE